MSYGEVCDAVRKIKKEYRENDPVKLCAAMGIKLLPFPLGTDKDCIKGFCREEFRVKVIVYNSDLPPVVQRIIIFHELGHAILHAHDGAVAFHDVAMFNSNGIKENEANLFAAEYMLSDEEVISALNSDGTFFTSAASLNVPTEFLDFKFRIMKWKGYRITESPIAPKSNFLLDMEVPENHDCDPS